MQCKDDSKIDTLREEIALLSKQIEHITDWLRDSSPNHSKYAERYSERLELFDKREKIKEEVRGKN